MSLSEIGVRHSMNSSQQSIKNLQGLAKSERQMHFPIQNTDQVIVETVSFNYINKLFLQNVKLFQALIHQEKSEQSEDEYYKRFGTIVEESNYTTVIPNSPGLIIDSPVIGVETDRSLGNEIDTEGPVLVTFPIQYKPEDETNVMVETQDSFYNPNYSLEAQCEVRYIKVL